MYRSSKHPGIVTFIDEKFCLVVLIQKLYKQQYQVFGSVPSIQCFLYSLQAITAKETQKLSGSVCITSRPV